MELNFKKFGDKGQSILILHGFLGSLDNWISIAKNLSVTNQVYLIDQRNHGRSPHSEIMNYKVLANDVFDFLNQNNIENIVLIGHSMGGKTAMLFSLLYPSFVKKLIVVDIAPVEYSGGHEFILDAMDELDLEKYENRLSIEKDLSKKIKAEVLLQFVLKNLGRTSDNKFIWKINLPFLIKCYRNLMAFPESHTQFEGDTLIIKGGDSDYIDLDKMEKFKFLFPNLKIREIVGTGHWVQAENPIMFLEVVKEFLLE